MSLCCMNVPSCSFNPKKNHPCVKDLYCLALRSIHSLKVAQNWVLVVNQTDLENDKSKSVETNITSKINLITLKVM